jgi:acyl carrier protein
MTDTATLTPDLEKIIDSICRIGKIDSLFPAVDMYTAGLRSIDALTLLMELEEMFGLSFPDDKFIAARTPAALHELLIQLRAD